MTKDKEIGTKFMRNSLKFENAVNNQRILLPEINSPTLNHKPSIFTSSLALIDKISSNALHKDVSNEKFENHSKNLRSSVSLNNKDFFCPFCDHCKQTQSSILDDYLITVKECKNLISKTVEYAHQTDIVQKGKKDIFDNNSIYENILKFDEKSIFNENHSNENYQDHNEGYDVKIENFLKNIPRSPNIHKNKNLKSSTMIHLLQSLVDENIELENLIPKDIYSKFKNSLFSKGISFALINEDNFVFDEEISNFFDKNYRDVVQEVFRKRYLRIESSSFDFISSHDNKDSELNNKILKMQKIYFILFIVYLQILSTIYTDDKDLARLLYIFFKFYFAQQEKKWVLIVHKLKEKIRYYKDLCKVIIQQKHKYLMKIELINEVLFSNILTQENLINHKKLIKDLLNVINEKRDEIYLLKSTIESLESELKFWIYDFDLIKVNNDIRNKIKEIDINNLVRMASDEIDHKKITKEIKSVLVNADRFLIVSGQRTFFSDKLYKMEIENERLNELYKKNYFKKNNIK